jgi:hypothetical protein
MRWRAGAIRAALLVLAMVWIGSVPCRADDELAQPRVRFTGEFKLIDVTSRAREGDVGFAHEGDDTRQTNLAGLRLMLADADGAPLLWEIHYAQTKIDQGTIGPAPGATGADLFRYEPWRWDIERRETDGDHPVSGQSVIWTQEIDRASVRWQGEGWAASLGRQPISFGTGRFWQPLDVFGAFSPTELEREYKPGVDAVLAELAPSSFSTLTGVLVASPKDEPEVEDSAVLHGRVQLGEVTEVTALAGRVREQGVAGASVETAWLDAGWRLEALRGDPPEDEGDPYTFAIAGVDRQFGNGVFAALEWYRHSAGAAGSDRLAPVALSRPVQQGFQKQLSRDLAGLTVQKDLTALLNGSYTMLASFLEGAPSQLHQATLTYSVANEADALFSVLTGGGRGLDALGRPRSEFGHVPDTLYLRLRFYF